MYSASFSVSRVTEATPAVSVGVASGEEEMTTGAGAPLAAVLAAVLTETLAGVAVDTPDVTVPGALAGFLSRWAALPEIAGSAGVKFILGAVRRSGNGKILPEGLNYCYPRHSHCKERRSQLTLEPFSTFQCRPCRRRFRAARRRSACPWRRLSACGLAAAGARDRSPPASAGNG